MPPRPTWPPTIHVRGTVAYVKVRAAGGARRQVNLGPAGSDEARAAYVRLLAELQASGGALPPTPAPGLTVTELIVAYDHHAGKKYQKGGRPTGQLDRVRRVLRVVRDLYGPTPAAEFGPLALEAVRGRLVDLGWSRGYIASAVGCVRRAWKWGVSQEAVPEAAHRALCTLEPLRRGTPGVREGKRVGPATAAQVEATLPHLGRVVADMVRVHRLTGMRSGELCAMRPGDVRRDGALEGVGRFPGLWLYLPESHKTEHHGHRRVIFLGPQAQALLAPYFASPPLWDAPEVLAFLAGPEGDGPLADWLAECDAAPRDPAAPFFSPLEAANLRLTEEGRRVNHARTRHPGDRYPVASYGHAVTKAVARANRLREPGTPAVPHWSPHQLRHATATAVAGAYDLEVAGAVLSHETLQVTQRYADTLALAAEAMRQLG